MGSIIRFTRPDGQSTSAYLATPTVNPIAPAVVVIQEWWGLNDQIKRVADQLASNGWRALVPDLFHGKLAADRDEASHLMDDLDWSAAVEQDVRGAIDHLRGAKVAVMGFCMGGALTLWSLARHGDLAAGVCCYGIPPEHAVDPAKIRAPLLCHFAKHDDWCTSEVIDALAERLDRGEVRYQLYRYDAQHAFMNDARPEVYDAGAAQLAWDRTVAFLRQNLG